MTITITDHSVKNGDTVEIVYRLTDADKFHRVACQDRDGREYARHHVNLIGEIGKLRFKLAHGRSIRVCLTAWAKDSPGYVQSDYVDIHVPYPLDVEAVRAIVREELGVCLGKPGEILVNNGDQPTATDSRPANCRFRLQDEGKPYPRSSCAACGRTITTGLGKSCHLADQPTKPTSVDDLVQVIKAELIRQHEAPGPSPYVSIGGDGDPTVLDGTFDLRALATAILAGETPCA